MNTKSIGSKCISKIKKYLHQAVVAAVVITINLSIFTLPAGAKIKKKNFSPPQKLNKKQPQKTEKGFPDADVDTTTVTNHNTDNFKKGLIGDNAVTAASSNPFYKLDVIAKQGTQGLTNIFNGSTLNSSGLVSFAGQTSAGYAHYVGDRENSPRAINPPTTSLVFDGQMQINENGKVAAITSSLGGNTVRVLALRDTNPPNTSVLIATTGVGIPDYFDSINSNPTVNRFDNPVFSGIKNNQLRLAYGYRNAYTFLKTYAAGTGGTLRPMIADNGAVAAREVETGGVQRLILFNYGPNNFLTIADESRFNSIGTSPGISDDGGIVVFQGDLKPDGSASYNDFYQTTSGPGIFASIDLGDGTRKMLRISGIQSEDVSGSGNKDGICDKNEVCVQNELGYDGTGTTNAGNPIRFQTYDTLTRVGVARQELGNPGITDDVFTVSFAATPSGASPSALFSNQTGLWTIHAEIKSKEAPATGYDYIVAKAKPVIQINDMLDNSTVQQIGFNDPISIATNDDFGAPRQAKKGDHRVAFWVQTNNGPKIVRGTYFDTDEDGLPDHWESNGLTVGGQLIDLPAMGSNPLHKDIFVQTNWLDSSGSIVLKPRPAALQKVIDSFKNAPVSNPDGTSGINIHIDAGPNSIMNPRTSKKWNSLSRAGSFAYTSAFGSNYSNGIYDWKDFDLFKTFAPFGQSPQSLSFFQTGRSPVFRLALFVDTFAGQGNSGITRSLPATDFIISLGQFPPQQYGTIAQAGTFMHELGHSLGLKHGGIDHVKYKPNFISIMNYSFQFSGLIKADNSPEVSYSRKTLDTLTETNLNESVGINDPDYRTVWYAPATGCVVQKSTQTSIDWNVNGIFNETGVSADLNGDNPSGCKPGGSITILRGYNDWPTVNYDANGALGGNGAGSSNNPATNFSSEETITQILAASRPELINRQACEPVDNVNVTVTGSQAPVTVNFDGSGSTAPCGTIVSYSWDFGDGTTGTGANVSHFYTGQGTFIAKLTLTDSNGNTTLIPAKYQIMVTGNYSISGRVTDSGGNGISNVTINLTGGQTASVQTDSSGNYSFASIVSGESYTVTPAKDGVRFNPANRTYDNLDNSKVANFQSVSGNFVLRNKLADFDGDGKTDLSVFRPSNGYWYYLNRYTGNFNSVQWGLGTDKLTPGDYDGDGKTDFAVYRPSDTYWYILKSSTLTLTAYQWGVSTDIPVAGDYDGDGKADTAVWRPSDGTWYVLRSSDLGLPALHMVRTVTYLWSAILTVTVKPIMHISRLIPPRMQLCGM